MIKIPAIILLIGCLLALEGCHIFGANEEKEPEYLWRKMKGLADQRIYDLALRDDETLVVDTDKGMFMTQPLAQPLQKVDLRNSLSISVIREIVVGDSLFYLSASLPNQLWTSADGKKWELLLTKKDPMFNIWITPEGDRIIGTWHGIYRQPGGSSNVELIKFLYTNHFPGLDQITSFIQTSSGALFCGSHDGVYRSVDTGLSWKKVSHDIDKSEDFVVELYTDPNNRIYVQTYDGLFRSDDEGDNWEQISSIGGVVVEAQFPGNGTVVVMTDKAVWKASLADGKFHKVGPGRSGYWEVEATENGKIVVATDSSVFVGTPNPLY